MKPAMRLSVLLSVIACLASGPKSARAAETPLSRSLDGIHQMSGSCVIAGNINPGQTVTGALTTSDCSGTSSYFDFWTFPGTAGTTVHAHLTSASLGQILVTIQDYSSGSVLAYNTGFDDATVSYTPLSSTTYIIGIATVGNFPETGSYSLSLSSSGGGGGGACTPDSQTLCLNNGRFAVQASFQTPQGQTGNGQAVALTGDTGYFWFFNANNVEVVVKVLDGCPVNNRYWVFAGGLTNVEVELQVTDTQTGASRVYHNPLGTQFQPVQDANAFNACP